MSAAQSVASILKPSFRLVGFRPGAGTGRQCFGAFAGHSGIPHKVPDAVLELLVRTFRDLRANGEKKTSMDTLTAIISTAEAVNVAHAVRVRAWF